MILDYKHSNPCSDIQQTHTDRSEQPGPLADRTRGVGLLRLVYGMNSALAWCVGGISYWRRRRTAIRRLQALNDHYLKDIGLERSEIVRSVEETTKLNTHLS